MTNIMANASFKVTVLSQKPGNYWIFDTTVGLPAVASDSTTMAPTTTTLPTTTTTVTTTTTTTTTTRDPSLCYGKPQGKHKQLNSP